MHPHHGLGVEQDVDDVWTLIQRDAKAERVASLSFLSAACLVQRHGFREIGQRFHLTPAPRQVQSALQMRCDQTRLTLVGMSLCPPPLRRHAHEAGDNSHPERRSQCRNRWMTVGPFCDALPQMGGAGLNGAGSLPALQFVEEFLRRPVATGRILFQAPETERRQVGIDRGIDRARRSWFLALDQLEDLDRGTAYERGPPPQ
jgi:hypothetical protein